MRSAIFSLPRTFLSVLSYLTFTKNFRSVHLTKHIPFSKIP